MTIRGKMQCIAKKINHWNGDDQGEVFFQTAYDPTLPEDARFSKATPSGEMRLLVDNETAFRALRVGAYYYIDLVPDEPKKIG